MAVNLSKHKESMLAAWREVVDDKSTVNWGGTARRLLPGGRRALFGYEGQSNDLKFISKGDGGLEEMSEDLNSGSIMYAFCQVQDPKTSLPKCVLINWQGEGAPVVRKGMCANHLRAVTDFFKGVHVTINARTDEDVDPKLVIDKVVKSTGSAYSFKERSNIGNNIKPAPVGTTYQRVNPGQEINSKERDKFWEREEQEERKRQEEERYRRDEEKRRQEEERQKREMLEAAERDKRVAQQNALRNAARDAEDKVTSVEQRVRSEGSYMDGELAEREQEERERRQRSEVLRRQRSEEAQLLIGKRTINARAVFEQNTAAGQLHNVGRRASYQPTNDTSRGKTEETSPEANSPPHDLGRKASLPSWPPVQENSSSSIVCSPAMQKLSNFVNQSKEKPVEEENSQSEEDHWESEDSQTGTVVRRPHKKVSEKLEEPETVVSAEPNSVGCAQPTHSTTYANGATAMVEDEDDDGDLGLRARALYDYQAADNTEISFDPGDIITHIEQIDEGWWQGLSPDGTFGLFPANYVELLD